MKTQSGVFDFDEWQRLFESDPDAFEARRRATIDSAIRRAPGRMQQRLRRLQWRIDATRRRYKHPTVSSAKLFEMMLEKVYGKGGLLEALTAPQPTAAPSKKDCENLVYLRQRD